jgi:cytosine/adenosine deaminase-related metal-dependent hydrolase
MILLKNGTFINWETLEFSATDILVDEGSSGKLQFVPHGTVREAQAVVDCTGMFITKSFVNGHHHIYSALARGMNPPQKNPVNFPEILQYIWWNLDKSLDLEMIRSSALATAIACAKSGVTFAIDHHASPFAVEGSLETIAKAFDEVGVGHLLCFEISDRDGLPIAEQGLSETENYFTQRQGLVGLHASFTVGENTLKQAVQLAEKAGSGIHVHTAEDRSDEDHCQEHYQDRIISRFKNAGVLQFPKTILAHCIHLDIEEREIVSQSPVWIVQNPDSNLNNGVGNFTSEGLGKRIMLGTDGMHSDILHSAKTAFFSGHNYDTIDYPDTYRRLRNAHHYLKSNGFSGDGENNLVVLDYDSPTPLHSSNFYGHFLFGIEPRHVRNVIAGGKLILKDRIITTVDEKAVLDEARIQAERLWKKMG